MYEILHISDMIFRKLCLPDERSRARVIGKEGLKNRDLEQASGARLEVGKMEVCIWAPNEESVELAQNLVLKCTAHGQAANRPVAKKSDLDNPVKSDLKVAAYYTYCD